MSSCDRRAALAALSSLWLAACGGGGGEAAGSPPAAPTPPAPAPGPSGYGDFRAAALGAGAALNGAVAFPGDNPWNTDISAAPVDPNSAALIAGIGLDTGLHPDFGAGLYNGAPIGIPTS